MTQLSSTPMPRWHKMGEAWRKGGVSPLDNLKINDLKTELERREENTANKKKPELEEMFTELRAGINNVPALLQKDPTVSISSLHLDRYEIRPTEPLHDIKDHLSNMIEEIRAQGNVKTQLEKVMSAMLSKETLRASDYRKAVIVLYKILSECNADSEIVHILRTGMEITELLYSSADKRTATTILRLHNISFQHGMLCASVFIRPTTKTRRAMFGRYYYSLTTHAAIVNRTTALHSLNTENEERMFQQMKQITLTTSSRRPNDILKNALLRIQEESNVHTGVPQLESEIARLASALPVKENTVFSWNWISQHVMHYQTHLERISDYLQCGRGVWWDYCDEGVKFYDTVPNAGVQPAVLHFRSNMTHDVLSALQKTWERICSDGIILPIREIRRYGSDGKLTHTQQAATGSQSQTVFTSNEPASQPQHSNIHVPPSNTPTHSHTSTPTQDSTLSNTLTPTQDSTLSNTSTPTQHSTLSNTSTPTQDSTLSNTSTPTQDSTLSNTSTPTQDSTLSNTSTPTQLLSNQAIETRSGKRLPNKHELQSHCLKTSIAIHASRVLPITAHNKYDQVRYKVKTDGNKKLKEVMMVLSTRLKEQLINRYTELNPHHATAKVIHKLLCHEWNFNPDQLLHNA